MGMTTKQAAEFLGIKPRAVVKLIHEGKIAAAMHGRDWDVDTESVKHYAENRPKPGPKPKARKGEGCN